ncbi:peptidase inhibitor family I36 protein [Streptomyces sp. NPDC059118]|uniref:peptidase inhibitor family I36 protein n=1 Tax=unclassified Streptomyces TaxID=2593676 RepID=UPI00369DA27D
MTATYNGQTIDLGEGWQGAAICTEVAAGDVRCYDTPEEEQLDLADESLGHALEAEAVGLKVPNALSTKGAKQRTLTEVPRGAAGALADVQDVSVGIQSIEQCTYGFACVYDATNYTGRILKFASGGKNLADWDFRDKTGSACNNKSSGGMDFTDFRTGLPDPHAYTALGTCNKMTDVDYPYGGDWNNKADHVSL